MAMRGLLFLILLGGTVILLTGAWTSSKTLSTQEPEVAFISYPVPLDEEIIGTGVDAKQLLQSALDKMTPKRMPWLNTKIRQTLTDAQLNFVAEGFLQRGPHHCARLEMNLREQKSLRVVSDGETLVEVREGPNPEPEVVVERLPEEEAAKEERLNAKGCSGPVAVLRQIQQDLTEGTLQTGLLDNVPVIRIRGDLDAKAKTAGIRTAIPARIAYVYLNAKTLWPRRLEWYGTDKANASRRILCMEFSDPEPGDLTVADCTRMFSYRPDEDRR